MKNSVSKSAGIRVWHWINALVIFGILGTVLLRETFLNIGKNVEIITSELEKAGTTITPDSARDVARALRSPMWEWHYILGFALVALIVFRIIILIIEKEYVLYGRDTRGALRFFPKSNDPIYKNNFHKVFVKLLHAGSYILLFVLSLSGLALYFKTNLALAKDITGTFKEIHETSMLLLIIFTALHIGGVILAEFSSGKGIISRMFNGHGENVKKAA